VTADTDSLLVHLALTLAHGNAKGIRISPIQARPLQQGESQAPAQLRVPETVVCCETAVLRGPRWMRVGSFQRDVVTI